MKLDERELRGLFARLHEDDAPPSFERVWRAAARRSGRRTRRLVLAAATAMTLLVAAGIALRWQGQPPAAPVGSEGLAAELAAELASWSSPLEFLGEVPGDELYAGQPLPPGEARELLQLMRATETEFGETL